MKSFADNLFETAVILARGPLASLGPDPEVLKSMGEHYAVDVIDTFDALHYVMPDGSALVDTGEEIFPDNEFMEG